MLRNDYSGTDLPGGKRRRSSASRDRRAASREPRQIRARGVAGLSALTLAIGGPFYEAIAEKIENDLGGVQDAVDLPWWRLTVRKRRALALGLPASPLSAIRWRRPS